MRRLIFCCLALILASGCSSLRLRDSSPDTSLVFAYLDLEESGSVLTWATLKQILPKTDRPYYYMGYLRDKENKYRATVWFTGLAPGTYQITIFGGKRYHYSFLEVGTVLTDFEFPDTGRNETAVEIEKPGLYFLGSFKYRLLNSRWSRMVGMEKATMEPVTSPTREEVLSRLLPIAAGSNWEGRIRNDLAVGTAK